MDIEGIEDNPIPEETRPSRATQAELEQRVEYTAMMLIDGRRKAEIKRFFKNQYGLSSRQIERYLRLARNRLVEETEKTRRELISESWGFYMRILHDPNATLNEKMQARSKADDLMGLQAPRRVIEAQVEVDDVLDMWVDNLTEEQKLAIDSAASMAEEVEKIAMQERALAREEEYRRTARPSDELDDGFDTVEGETVEHVTDDDLEPLEANEDEHDT